MRDTQFYAAKYPEILEAEATWLRTDQVLANYQMLPQGGGGYLRVMQFFPTLGTVHVQTYSPSLDVLKTDPDF